MLFYKVEGVIANSPTEQDDSRRAHRENVRKLSIKSDDFNQKFCRASFYFISACSDGVMTIGVIADRSENLKETLNAYIKHIEIEFKDLVVSEITISSIENLLGSADRQDYISDDDEILERYGLDRITGRRGRGIEYGENIIEERSKKTFLVLQKNTFCTTLFCPNFKESTPVLPLSNHTDIPCIICSRQMTEILVEKPINFCYKHFTQIAV